MRHGIRVAGLSALASVALFTVVTVLSYKADQRFIEIWEGYRVSEEQLFQLRVDASRLFEIEHRLTVGAVSLDEDLREAGTELAKVPSIKAHASRKIEILNEARQLLVKGQDSRAREILNGREMNQVNKALRETLFAFELNERGRLQQKLEARLDSQAELLRFDLAAIMLGVILLISASVLVLFYIERLRRFDRDIIVARNEAERASRMKSSFLANMSHEIRTPLNGVLGLTRLLRETTLDLDQQDMVESLEASGRTLLSIVNDILDLSKIESGKIEIESEEFNVHELVKDLERAFRVVADRKSLRLVVDGPQNQIPVCGDPVKIRQILQNLLSNALKFTKEGEVRLRWRIEPGPSLRFEVKDTGIGIPNESMHRIFHPFEQADSSTSRHFGGSGLGLAICRHLIEAMGGKLGVESRVGLGSRFWFSVPCAPQPGKRNSVPVRAPIPEATASSEGRGGRILLVEDNEVNQHLVVTFLRRRGFEVMAAFNGIEALNIFRDHEFDVVLMDAHLPEMDGFEATRRLRQGEAGKRGTRVPILALTASAIKGEREKCLNAGMNDYLTKPVDLDQLEKAVRGYLGEQQTTAPAQEKSVVTPTRSKRPHDLDEDLYQDLVAIFLKITPDRIKDLRLAIEKNDHKAAGRMAHTMKSSAAQLGLDELAAVCKRMELKGLSGSDEDWAVLMNEFEVCMERTLSKLRTEHSPSA